MKYVPVINPNGTLSVFRLLEGRVPTLEWLQEQVGGYIEMVQTCLCPDLIMLVNDEGILRGLPTNPTATDMQSNRDSILVGPAIVLAVVGENFVPLSIEDLANVTAFCSTSTIRTERLSEGE